MLVELEALHGPAREEFPVGRPVCQGCDADGFDATDPEWPCRTAMVLWPDPDERDAVLAEWHEWADPVIADRKARPRRGGQQLIPEAWSARLLDSLQATTIYQRPGDRDR